MWKGIVTAFPLVLFLIWVTFFHVQGASIWVGFVLVVFLTIGLARITGTIKEVGEGRIEKESSG